MSDIKNKKAEQLGMNPSTANGRLLKNILYQLVVDLNKDLCYQCGKKISKETFSIEHKIPWLDSEKPLELYFDLNNIAFSHLSCNIKASRNGNKKINTAKEDLLMKRSSNKKWRDRLDEVTGLTNRQLQYQRSKLK